LTNQLASELPGRRRRCLVLIQPVAAQAIALVGHVNSQIGRAAAWGVRLQSKAFARRPCTAAQILPVQRQEGALTLSGTPALHWSVERPPARCDGMFCRTLTAPARAAGGRYPNRCWTPFAVLVEDVAFTGRTRPAHRAPPSTEWHGVFAHCRGKRPGQTRHKGHRTSGAAGLSEARLL
jgi:hypothetical protein